MNLNELINKGREKIDTEWVLLCIKPDGTDKTDFTKQDLYDNGIGCVYNYLTSYLFQINPKKILDWNTFLDDEWGGLDDAEYYTEAPEIEEEEASTLVREWLYYDKEYGLCTIEDKISSLKKEIEKFTNAQTLLSDPYYMYN